MPKKISRFPRNTVSPVIRGMRKLLFQVPPDFSTLTASSDVSTWDVTGDGQRFLMPAPLADSSPSPFTVILNWTSMLKK